MKNAHDLSCMFRGYGCAMHMNPVMISVPVEIYDEFNHVLHDLSQALGQSRDWPSACEMEIPDA